MISALQLVRAFRRPLFVLYVASVLVLTLAPLPSGSGRLPRWFDKLVHFGLFVGMSIMLYLNLSKTARHHMTWVAGSAALFAGAIELAQGPLAFRSGDWWDFVWGTVGAVIGWLIAEGAERLVPA